MTKKMKAPLPTEYSWLGQEKFPRILIEALKLYGTREKQGSANNPEIMLWSDEVEDYLGAEYSADSVPWCGLFMAVCAFRAGYIPPEIAIRAMSWNNFGNKSDRPKLGDILVFLRNGGGHVGLYVGEDLECYHVLGGNQGDSVSITRISRERFVSARECQWKIRRPDTLRPIFLDSKGAISHNEA